MKTTISPVFRPVDVCLSAESVAWRLRFNAEKRNPRMMETEEIRPLVWDRKHKAENEVILARLRSRHPAILARFNRRREWIAARNVAALAGMSEESAREHLTARASAALRWYECLPYGITIQAAANATGLPCWVEWWEGSHRFSRCYARGNAVRKFHAVAKAI